MSLISGWLALLGLALLVWVVVYVIRLSPKELRPAGPAVQVVSTTNRSFKRTSTRSAGTIVLYLLGILIAILIVINIIPIVGWVWDTIMHQGLGIKIVQPSSVVVRTPEYISPPVSVVTTQVQTEPESVKDDRSVLSLTYGERYAWIRVPDGYRTWFSVDGKKPVDAQCSSPVEEPSIDATGPDYDCRDGVRPSWIRFAASNAEEGPVTVRYHFKIDSVL